MAALAEEESKLDQLAAAWALQGSMLVTPLVLAAAELVLQGSVTTELVELVLVLALQGSVTTELVELVLQGSATTELVADARSAHRSYPQTNFFR